MGIVGGRFESGILALSLFCRGNFHKLCYQTFENVRGRRPIQYIEWPTSLTPSFFRKFDSRRRFLRRPCCFGGRQVFSAAAIVADAAVVFPRTHNHRHREKRKSGETP